MSKRYALIPTLAVEDRTLSHSALRTLCAIATHGDKAGWCFPSLGKLSEILGKSKPAISKDIRTLSEKGYLNVLPQYRANGSQTSNKYQVRLDYPPLPEVNPPINPQDTPPLTPGVNPPLTSEVNPPLTPGVNPLTEPIEQNQLTEPIEQKKAATPPAPIKTIVSQWNSLFPAKQVNDTYGGKPTKRYERIKKLVTERWLDLEFRDFWQENMRAAAQNPYLVSESWFRLDWFLGNGKQGNLPGWMRISEFEWKMKPNGVQRNGRSGSSIANDLLALEELEAQGIL